MARRRHPLGRAPRRLTSLQSLFVRAARPLGRVSARYVDAVGVTEAAAILEIGEEIQPLRQPCALADLQKIKRNIKDVVLGYCCQTRVLQ